MAEHTHAALSLRDVRFGHRGHHDLFVIDQFDLPRGEVHCLIGPSGVGKTTLLEIIAGLRAPDRGVVCIAGRAVDGAGRRVAPERRRVGFVFQDCQLFPHLSARRNVLFGMRTRTRAHRRETADSLLASLGVKHRADAKPHLLSGGERSRVAVARALATEPDLLVMDEPFASLDPVSRRQTRDSVLNTVRDTGTSALIVTHDATEAREMTNHVWRLSRISDAFPTARLATLPVDHESERLEAASYASTTPVSVEPMLAREPRTAVLRAGM